MVRNTIDITDRFLFCLKAFSVFSLFLILKHTQIRLVAAFGYIVVFKCFKHCTPRFFGVRTVIETTVLGEVEYLLEITRQLFRFDIKRSKTFDAWSVDEI